MTEREKQIEEMAKDLYGEIDYDVNYYSDDNCSEVNFDYRETAKNIVEKGWVKLPEGAVVLTREELQEHDKKLADDIITMFQKLAQNWASADIVNDTAKRLRKLYEV